MTGYAGDTLASALLANGVAPGRPLVQVPPPARHPDRRARKSRTRWWSCAAARGASRTPRRRPSSCYDGLDRRKARTAGLRSPSTCWRSIRCCRPSCRPASTTRPSCGRPRSGRRSTSPLIRRAAGLGRASRRARSRHYEKAYAFCDVLVIGGGPAGLMAALAAGRGRRAGDPVRRGFPLRRAPALRATGAIGDGRAADWAARCGAELAAMPDVRSCGAPPCSAPMTAAPIGALERVSDHLPVPPAHEPRQRLWHIVAKRVGAGRRRASSGRSCSAATTARRDAGGGLRSYLNRFAVAPGNAPSSSPTMTTAGAR